MEPYQDQRSYKLRGKRRLLRRFGQLPTNLSDPQTLESIYEAQISFLVSGFDEWYWTAYCFIDTFFNNDDVTQFYYDQKVDAAIGGERDIKFPVWNPRQCFLFTLSRRFRQVRKEWSILVDALDSRLNIYVGPKGFHMDSVDPMLGA